MSKVMSRAEFFNIQTSCPLHPYYSKLMSVDNYKLYESYEKNIASQK